VLIKILWLIIHCSRNKKANRSKVPKLLPLHLANLIHLPQIINQKKVFLVNKKVLLKVGQYLVNNLPRVYLDNNNNSRAHYSVDLPVVKIRIKADCSVIAMVIWVHLSKTQVNLLTSRQIPLILVTHLLTMDHKCRINSRILIYLRHLLKLSSRVFLEMLLNLIQLRVLCLVVDRCNSSNLNQIPSWVTTSNPSSSSSSSLSKILFSVDNSNNLPWVCKLIHSCNKISSKSNQSFQSLTICLDLLVTRVTKRQMMDFSRWVVTVIGREDEMRWEMLHS